MVAQIRSWYGRNPAIALALVGLLAVSVVLGLWLIPASAATTTLYPDGGTPSGLNSFTISGTQPVLNDADDATHYSTSNNNSVFHASVQNASGVLPAGAVITQIVARYTARADNGSDELIDFGISIGGTDIAGATGDVTPVLAATTYPETFTGSWTITDLDSLEAYGVYSKGSGKASTIYVTEAWFELTYTVAIPDLSVSGTNNTGVPTAKVYREQGAQIAVDRISMTATDGDVEVSGITVSGVDTVDALTTDVTGVSIWRDDGSGAFESGSDTQVGSTQTFSGPASLSTAVFSFTNTITDATTADFWIVYDIGALAVDGHIVGSRLLDGNVSVTGPATVTSFSTIDSFGSGATVEIDTSLDSVTLADPLTNDVLTGSTKTISGTAADADSGLSSVEVQIIRDGTEYWDGSGWAGADTWNTAAGTTNWTYGWSLDAAQSAGDHTYTVQARATDNVGNVGTSPTSIGITVDNTPPTLVSALAVDATHVDVVFTEDVDGTSFLADGTGFTIAGLTVSGAVLDGTDDTLVHLTTSAQVAGNAYTVQVAVDTVDDLYGTGNTLTTAGFTGFTPDPVLSVSGANNVGVPTTLVYRDRGARLVVDRLTLTAADGSVDVTEIVVRGLDTVGELTTDVTGVSLWEDDGDGSFDDASDTQVGSTQVFSGAASGSTATFGSLGYSASIGASDIWVVYDIGASAVDGHIVGSQLVDGDVTVTAPATVTFTTTPITSAGSTAGQTAQIDAVDPTANVTDPLSSATLTGVSKQISIDAIDTGSGLSTVQVHIERSGGTYWDGGAWIADANTWNNAADSGGWKYTWALDANQNAGDYTYIITARSADNVGRMFTDPTPVTNVTVDNLGPAMVSAIALDDTHVDVVFDEDLTAASIAAGDFTIAGLTVTGAALDGVDLTLVHLTTSTQGSGTSYTVSASAADVIDDLYGNGNAATSANFTGFAGAGALTVSQGADAGRPSTQRDIGVNTVAVVDELVLSASGGDVTVGQIVVRGLDTDNALTSNVSAVRLFIDDGNGVFVDGPDVQLGSTQTFASDASGSTVTFGSLGYVVSDGVSRDIWVVYTVPSGASDGSILGSRVNNGDITASTGSVNGFTDIVSADAGQTLVVDAAAPSANTGDPLSSAVLTGSTKQVSGTASDGTGSGLDSVVITIARSDGTYWDGSSWAGVTVWNPATGTDTWTYDWSLDAGQNREYTYIITARATDNVGLIGTDSTPVTGVTVDNEGPSIVSVSTLDESTVDIVFDENVAPATIDPSGSDISIPGLTISAAVLQGDSKTLRLTTSVQTPDQSYTASILAGAITDTLGNAGLASSAGFLGYGSTSDTTPPSIPANVVATPGVLPPTVATITWDASTDDVSVSGYKVWRSLAETGTYVAQGTTAGLSYDDDTGIPGEDYYYKVTAFDASGNESGLSDFSGPVVATWTQAPHATYSVGGNLCRLCHDPHEAAVQSSLMRDTGDDPTESSVCYSCHDGQGASTNIKAGADNSFALASGHVLEEAEPATDLTNRCSSCHGPHADYTGLPYLPRTTVNGVAVTDSNNTWCMACHNDTNDWYGAGYPSAATPTRDATGYPTLGTFPGETVYTDASANAHVSIPASATASRVDGDCLYCHAAHKGPNGYDGLNEEYRPSTAPTLADDQANGTYAESCFTCHGGVIRSEFTTAPVDIKQFVTASTLNAGHRIKTAGGNLPVGSPLPCYDCHNPHGSTRGNGSLLTDELGQNLSAGSDSEVRSFCFSCHTSSDAQIWDSVTTAYVGVGAQTVEGLQRNGGDGSALLIPSNTGHASTDTQSCYQCHGDSYASSGFNVHNPTGGVSTGGSGCYACHGVYQPNMEDSTLPKIGAANTSVYHHVLGGAAGDGDIAPKVAAYPTSTSDVYCVSCHSDHNYFNSSPGTNLRSDIADADGSTTANSDFSTSAPYGICISCHATSAAKDTTNQKDDGTTDAQPIDGAAFNSSAHQYTVSSEFGGGNTFNADCSKCHNDEQTKEFQTSTYSFGTHYSAARRLLSAFGATVTDPLEENHCYECHAPVGSYPGAKTVSNQDWYGASGAVMDDPSEYVYESIEDLGGSSHPIKATAGGTVECESCHNPHVVQTTAGNRVTDPDNTLNLAAYTTAAEQAAFCIQCHDGTAPSYVSNATTYVPYDVTLANAADDKTTYAARGHWSANGSISSGEIEACASCHDNHGSAAPKLLGEYDSGVGGNAIRTTDITANDNTVCFACHAAASTGFPGGEAQREAVTGYLSDGTWPGTATYSTAYTAVTHTGNGHLNADGGVAGTSLPGYAAGDCKVCHDVHGTANTYDELRLTFEDQDYTLCLDCHDAGGPAGADIERFYPAATGGSNAGDRSGHRIVSSAPGAMLVAGEALPCYDCHNPHGSESAYMLQVGSVGDTAGEINLSTATGVRNFCFACHTTADGARGWDGSSMAVVSAGTEVEGIDRANTSYRLRLPSVSGHNDADTGTSCYACHGNDYSAADSQNVHNPGPGESAGGTDCFDCHSYTDMQSSGSYHHYMTSDSAASYPVIADPSTLTATDAARTCLSCHVDHDYFSPNFNADAAHTDGRAQNLRSSISVAPSVSDGTTYLSADFDKAAGGDGGVCVSCHKVQMTKNTTGRSTAGDRSADTVPITATGYDSTAHDYLLSATGLGHEGATFGSDSSDFGVNCAKCHNDEQTKLFQSSTHEFGVHDSAKQRILTALGQTGVPVDAQEELCYLCHSRAFEAEPRNPNGGADYTVAATADAYGALDSTGMFDWSVNVKGSFTNASIVSRHPVTGDGSTTARVECLNCHNVHKTQADLGFFGDGVAQDPDNTLLAVSEGDAIAYYSSPSADTERKVNREYCLACHDGTTPSYVNDGTAYVPYDVFIPGADAADMNKNAYVAKSHFNNVAGDTGATAVTIDQTCGDCHDTHGSTLPALLGPSNGDDILGTREINLTAVTGNNNTICQACHNAATTNYPQPTTFANGYPELGTWPGFTVYNTARNATSRAGNGHLAATGGGNTNLPGYAAGDCKTCHDVHGTAEDYDELRLAFTPTDFTLCFDCHDADGDAGRNIKTYYPGAVGGAGGGTGHYIQTAGGNLAVNDVMPCYTCHNPHGTANTSFGLQVVTMTDSSTTIVVGDAAGEIAMSPAEQATASNVRNFCFVCHTTADTTKGWNGSGMAVVGAGATVEGLDRTTGTLLKLPSVTGHNEADPQSCYLCHGSDYSGLSTNNVHNPSGGVSNGGSDCYSCHTAYQASMEDQLLTDKGTLATAQSTYHHVMGSASAEGDAAFSSGNYPTAGTDVYCMSCHVDHDTFNADKAGNLRASTGNELASNADYDSGANTGVCTDCHASSLVKDDANTADSAGSTPIIVDGAAAGQFGASAHDYYATSTYGDATTFNANCSKCHNDEATKDFQTSSIRFGTHYSAASRILSALGGTVADQLQENHCYRCHSETTDGLSGTDKSVANRDWYDVADMTTSGTEEVYQQFQLTSKHPVVSVGGNSVECESCHNAHVVSASSKVTDPDNTYGAHAYTNADDQALFCLTCHDGTTPSKTVNGTTYIPYSVTIAAADAAAMNKDDSALASKGHWTDNSAAGGSIGSGEEVACGDCHDNHGSAAPKLLGLYNPASGDNEIGAQTITANDNTVCKGCHTTASTNYPATDARRDSTGYLTSGVWPGSATYDGGNGIHKGASVIFPSSGLTGGDCKNCHEPHGTNNAYDMLVDTYDHDDYTLCFDCHDSSGPAATDIAALYTVASGGTSTDGRSGHQVVSATGALSGNTLAQGDAVPCFDCHNPHGSASAYGLQVRDIGDADDPFDMSTGAGVREFCFTCHSTSDTTFGWNGSAYATVAGLDVEGIPRDSGSYVLKLPALADHTQANTGDCLGCHADPHLLSGGGSSGGVDCYACHEGKQQLQTYMEDQLGTDKGTLASSQGTYHHVMGSASNDGDVAFSSGSYPNAGGTDVYCMSCHVDHDTFNTEMGLNLRAGLGNETGADTDFNSSTNSGVCTDCHGATRAKDTSNQKVGGSSDTPIIADGGATGEYGASSHDYYVNSTFGDGDTFRANCVKCHNDDASSISGSYSTHQISTNKFGLHYSSENRIAIALGAVKTGTSTSTEENLCYECHTGAAAGNDGYGGQAMTARERGIEAQFAKTYTHGVDGYSGVHTADEYANAPTTVNGSTTDGWWGSSTANKHVECEDCHNPHAAGDASNVFPDDTNTRGSSQVPISNANLGVWGVNITNPNAGSDGAPTQPIYEKVAEASYEWQMCLKCHSIYAWGTNTPPAVPSGQTKSVSTGSSTRATANMTDVGLDFNTNHYAYHPLYATGRNQPPTNANSGWTNSGIARQNATTIGLANTMTDGWLTTSLVTCSDCHGNNDWSSTASRGPHGSDQPWILRGVNTGVKVTLHTGGTAAPNASAPSGSGNLCINCHRADVYGYGDGSGPSSDDDTLSRQGHLGSGMAAKCGNGGLLPWAPVSSGCYLCHGGRGDDGTEAVGVVHGSSMGRGDGNSTAADGNDAQDGTLTGDEMGKRFMNGASWDAHVLGDTGGTIGCSTINADNQYSECAQHTGTKATASEYLYQWE